MAHPAEKAGHFTYGDYCDWPEDERWELIDGVAYAMTPAPSRLHQDFVIDLGAQIHGHLKDRGCKIYVAPFDVRFPHSDEADAQIDTVLQPDVAVICDPSKLDDKGCRGAPDWVIEILSPSTAARDMIQKRGVYERHGVREYWIVDPTNRLLTIYRLEAGSFGKPDIRPLTDKVPSAVLEGLEIDWSRLAS